jgi:hypothetical protein
MIFVWDQSLVNMWIMYLDLCKRFPDLFPMKKRLSHLYFNMGIADHLVGPQIQAHRVQRNPVQRPEHCHRLPHGPTQSSRKRKCIVCGFVMKWYCVGCDYKWMCTKNGYYTWYHNQPGFVY